MRILPKQPTGPSAAEFNRTSGTSYADMFKSAKQAALEVDGTPEDPDSRDGFVTLGGVSLGGDSIQTLVSLWGQAGEKSASVRFVGGTYVEEPPSPGRPYSLGTQKDRYIEITEDRGRGFLKVEDRLSQSLSDLDNNQGYDNTVIDDHKERGIIVAGSDGTVLAENPRDVRLLFDSGWSLAEFQKRKADLDG